MIFFNVSFLINSSEAVFLLNTVFGTVCENYTLAKILTKIVFVVAYERCNNRKKIKCTDQHKYTFAQYLKSK